MTILRSSGSRHYPPTHYSRTAAKWAIFGLFFIPLSATDFVSALGLRIEFAKTKGPITHAPQPSVPTRFWQSETVKLLPKLPFQLVNRWKEASISDFFQEVVNR